jgi:hypothetical protein
MALRIERQFRGPQQSANGGYACGVAAAGLPQPVEVTLHAPPPLERELLVERSGTEVRLHDAGELVVAARSVSDLPPVPVGPSYDDAQRAAAEFDEATYATSHPYPGCFTCGPHRLEGDGLRIFPGALEPGVCAWPWTPDVAFADEGGLLPDRLVWAALDCPSGQAWLTAETDLGAIVLGRMTARIDAPVPVGEPVVVAGWTDGADGRKRHAGAGIWTPAGELLAASYTTWFVLTEEQRVAFGAASASPEGDVIG